jgi:hypothetical protein
MCPDTFDQIVYIRKTESLGVMNFVFPMTISLLNLPAQEDSFLFLALDGMDCNYVGKSIIKLQMDIELKQIRVLI